MNNLRLSFSGPELSKLRAIVEAVGKEVELVTSPSVAGKAPISSNALDRLWTDLVQMLDLGPEPSFWPCPRCHALCMAGATRCGNCWAELPPPPSQSGTRDKSTSGQDPKQPTAALG